MQNDELIEFTEAVKNEILERGWTQRVAKNMHGEVCILGAVDEVTDNNFAGNMIWCDAFGSFLAEKGYLGIIKFNDETAQSSDDVIDELNLFIKELQNDQ